MFYET